MTKIIKFFHKLAVETYFDGYLFEFYWFFFLWVGTSGIMK